MNKKIIFCIFALAPYFSSAQSTEIYAGMDTCASMIFISLDATTCGKLPSTTDCQNIKDKSTAWGLTNYPSSSWNPLASPERQVKRMIEKQEKIMRTGRPNSLAELFYSELLCDIWIDEGHWKYVPSQWVKDLW